MDARYKAAGALNWPRKTIYKVKDERDISPNIYVLKFCKGPALTSHAANKLDVRYGNMWVH